MTPDTTKPPAPAPASAETLEQTILNLQCVSLLFRAESKNKARVEAGISALRRLQSTEHKLVTWDKVGEAASQRIATLEARLQSTESLLEDYRTAGEIPLVVAQADGLRTFGECVELAIEKAAKMAADTERARCEARLQSTVQERDSYKAAYGKCRAQIVEADSVIATLQEEKSSEQDRHVAAQEAITQHWQPRAEAAEQKLRDLEQERSHRG